MKSLVISPLVRHISCLVMVDVLDQLKCLIIPNKRKKFESCVDSLRLSEVSALHVRTKRSLIRAGVTPGGAERLFSQLATLTLITLTVHHHPPAPLW